MNNRQAFMIIAHNELGLLQKLVSALDHPEHDIYIHFDKSKFTPEVEKISAVHSPVTVISEVAVHWGSYSMIRCEMLLLKLATQTHHSYYHLLSGVDLPLKPAEQIYRFFEQTDREYVQFYADEFPQEYHDWAYYRHISAEKFRTGKNRLENKWITVRDQLGVAAQKLLGRKKKLRFTQLRKGAQWFSITEDFAKYVLSVEEEIDADFRDSYIPDEMVIPTVLYNSPWRDRQAHPEAFNNPLQNMRYIDWNRGGPYTFRIEDLQELRDSGCMFARKFSTAVDSRIIDTLTASPERNV